MLGSSLQTLIIAPREEMDPRLAQTDNSRLRESPQGILYKLANSRDWNRFQVLSDEEVAEELRRSQRLSESSPLSRSQRGRERDSAVREKGIKFVPPQLGVASRERQRERRAWHNSMQKALLNEREEGPERESDEYAQTIRALAANTKRERERDHWEGNDNDDDNAHTVISHRPHTTPLSPERTERAGEEDKVSRAFSVIQHKFEQNLHVVERLYSEKEQLEQYTRRLESELRRISLSVSPSASLSVHERDRERDSDDLLHTRLEAEREERDRERDRGGDEASPPLSVAPRMSTFEPPLSPFSHSSEPYDREEGLTAREMAALLNQEKSERERARQRMRANRSLTLSASQPLTQSHTHTHRSRSAPRTSCRTPSPSSHRTRRPRSSSRGSRDGLSLSLQADADRYVQRRRLIEERERLQREEEEQFLREREERRLRALRRGEAFTAMEERTARMKQVHEEKLAKLRAQERDAERRYAEEKKRRAREKEREMEIALRRQMSWKELREQEETQRRERIERRKIELQLESSLPKSMEESMQRAAEKKKLSVLNAEANKKDSKTFHAEDPQLVRERLQRQRQDWDERLHEEKMRLRAKYEDERRNSGFVLDEDGKSHLAKTTLEMRYEEYKEKREERKKLQQEKEEAERQKKREHERQKRERVMAAKIPSSSLRSTKKAETQREIVQKKLEEEERARKEEKARAKKKELALKEAAAALSVIVKEEERRLKSGNPSYLELTNVQKIAEDKAKQAREEYRQKLRENKKKLQESLKNRPSLIERHEMSLATRDAAAAALKKIANIAVASSHRQKEESKNNGDSDDYDDDDDSWLKGKMAAKKGAANTKQSDTDVLDDILDPKEKIMLGVK